MFGFGISEIITLAIVILVFINPKDLPIIVRKIGRTYGKIIKQINTLKKTYTDFEKEVGSVNKNTDKIKTETLKGAKT